MRHDDTGLSFSATDLANFSACAHRALLDRLRALGRARPDHFGTDPRLELLKERGIEHERAYLARLEAEGKRIVRFGAIPDEDRNPAGYARRAEETLAAMREGPDVIYQGTLQGDGWLGLVDFLLRVDRPSELGAWSYEVADAKLTREAKAAALLQTCVYSELLERVQGTTPERIHLYLGGTTPRLVSFRLAHYAAYYRALKARFLDHVRTAADDPPVAPEPVDLCQICDWSSRCRRERVAADHLSLVAGIARSQRRVLEGIGVETLAGLAGLTDDPPPGGLSTGSFQRIRHQALVQLTGRKRGAPYHELLPLEERPDGRPVGLAALPEPTPHDLFFDLEGADYAYEGGLEYLWGISDTRDDYRAQWALTQDEEKSALDRFLEMAVVHLAAHPDAHVYHYGHYEPSALKRLVGRYGIRTEELDRLLTQETFVDLHRIVKHGMRASVESYSIKALEEHYEFQRRVPMVEANRARGRLEYALSSGLRDDGSLADRPVVQDYNRDDCVSTRALRDWLEVRRAELEAGEGRTIPRPGVPVPPEEPAEDEVQVEVRELMEALLAGIPEERESRSEAEHIRWLAAHLLEWHRREDKSAWWDFFRLRDLSVEELVDETKPLAGLLYEDVVCEEKQSLIHRFRFPPQTHRLEAGKKGVDPHRETEDKDGKKGRTLRNVWALDELRGTVDLKVGKGTEWDPAALRALVPDEIVPTNAQRARLRRTAQLLLEGDEALGGWSPASLPLLRRSAPRFDPGIGLQDVAAGRVLLDRARQAVLSLREGILPVQGPPGTGKTYSGARMIRALLRAGRRVGVTGPSHKVITNLLKAVCEADEDDDATTIAGLQVSKEGVTDARFKVVPSSSDVTKAEAERAEAGLPPFNLVAGTAWLWSSEARVKSVDVLFIDEAGQFSLANALAVAPAAPRLVLLGDPQQLNQPQKGIHPPGTEVSVLEHLAGEDGILTPDQGLFLGETWRMRPEITAFTSELFYENKLESREDLTIQRLSLADGRELRGLSLIAVPHEGNSRESREETDEVLRLFQRLLDGDATFTDRKGESRPLALDDVLVVAPYNAQVSRIQLRLAEAGFDDARVGTVDKFQGQEAPVAVYSLASSSGEDAPRGMEFLYALDRLNVATSRARVATIVVASPSLFAVQCKRPEQMRMANAFARYSEMARDGA